MGILDVLQKIVQYPQSAVTGIAGFAPSPGGIARDTTGDFDILEEGFRGGLRPSEVMARNNPVTGDENAIESILRHIGETGTDLAYDPVNLGVGGAGKLAGNLDEGSKLASVLSGVGETGKLGIKTDPLAKAGQMGRRYYQGLMATGDPLSAVGAASLIGGGERAATKFIPAISRMLAKEDPDALAEVALKGISDDVAVGDSVQQALAAGRRPVAELNPAPTAAPREMGPNSSGQIFEQGPIIPDEIIQELNPGSSLLGLPPGARPMPGVRPMGQRSQSTSEDLLSTLLGKRQGAAFAAGDRPDSIIRNMLESNRSGTGKFLNAENKDVIQELINNPDVLGQLLRTRFSG